MGSHSAENIGNNFDMMLSDVTPQEALTAKRDQVLGNARDLTVGLFQGPGMEALLKSGMLQEVSRAADNTAVTLSMRPGHWVPTSEGMARIDKYTVPRGGTPELKMTYAATATSGGTTGHPEVHPDLQNSTSVNIGGRQGAMSVDGMSVVGGLGTPYNIDGRHDVNSSDPFDQDSVLRAGRAVEGAELAVTAIVAQAQQMIGAEPVGAGAHATPS